MISLLLFHELGRLFFHGRVPMILDCVVSPALEVLGEIGPLVA